VTEAVEYPPSKHEDMTPNFIRVPEAHACNPSYSGGSDQEDRVLKPAGANSSGDPILKNLSTKRGWWSGSRCRP
jgi:hypothetical protein